MENVITKYVVQGMKEDINALYSKLSEILTGTEFVPKPTWSSTHSLRHVAIAFALPYEKDTLWGYLTDVQFIDDIEGTASNYDCLEVTVESLNRPQHDFMVDLFTSVLGDSPIEVYYTSEYSNKIYTNISDYEGQYCVESWDDSMGDYDIPLCTPKQLLTILNKILDANFTDAEEAYNAYQDKDCIKEWLDVKPYYVTEGF